jgi:hypothetical protein
MLQTCQASGWFQPGHVFMLHSATPMDMAYVSARDSQHVDSCCESTARLALPCVIMLLRTMLSCGPVRSSQRVPLASRRPGRRAPARHAVMAAFAGPISAWPISTGRAHAHACIVLRAAGIMIRPMCRLYPSNGCVASVDRVKQTNRLVMAPIPMHSLIGSCLLIESRQFGIGQ